MQKSQSGINDDELNTMIANLQQSPKSAVANPNLANQNTNNAVNPVSRQIMSQPANPVTNSPRQDIQANQVNQGVQNTSTVQVQPNNQPQEPATDNNDLENIKLQAISSLRPLIDKLDLDPQDKFDTLLLLIRTTDDQSLIPKIYQAASNISNETARAQALLDVIKEIDFLSHNK